MKDATNIAALAAVILAMAALIGLIIPVYSRLGQLESEIRRLESEIKYSRELSEIRHQETLEEIRRLTDALGSHSHTPEGDVIFTVPPPRASDGPADSQPSQAIAPTPTPDQPAAAR